MQSEKYEKKYGTFMFRKILNSFPLNKISHIIPDLRHLSTLYDLIALTF